MSVQQGQCSVPPKSPSRILGEVQGRGPPEVGPGEEPPPPPRWVLPLRFWLQKRKASMEKKRAESGLDSQAEKALLQEERKKVTGFGEKPMLSI